MKFRAGIIVLMGFLLGAATVFGDTAPAPTPQESSPLPLAPGVIVQNLYTTLLFVSGFLAVGAIVWGAIVYVSAAGNPGKQKDGKEWIEEALKGLLLLFAAVLLLRTVNPDLINLNMIGFVGLKARELKETQLPISCKGGPCVAIQGKGIAGCKNGCGASARMAEVLQCAAGRSNALIGTQIVVTEAMPPSSGHSSGSHSNGCAVDLVVGTTGVDVCRALRVFMTSAQACGSVYMKNEYAGNPACPGGEKSDKWTGNHLHLQGC